MFWASNLCTFESPQASIVIRKWLTLSVWARGLFLVLSFYGGNRICFFFTNCHLSHHVITLGATFFCRRKQMLGRQDVLVSPLIWPVSLQVSLPQGCRHSISCLFGEETTSDQMSRKMLSAIGRSREKYDDRVGQMAVVRKKKQNVFHHRFCIHCSKMPHFALHFTISGNPSARTSHQLSSGARGASSPDESSFRKWSARTRPVT